MPDRPADDKSKAPMLSRADQLKQEHKEEWWYEPDAPEITCGRYLIDYLFEVGPFLEGAMGMISLTHEEIYTWQNNIGLQLSPGEVRLLKILSREYVSMANDARDVNCPAPWGDAEYAQTEKRRKAMAMKKSMREIAKI